MAHKKIYDCLFAVFPLLATAQFQYPENVQAALNLTDNKVELEKALQYFYKTKDSIKIKSINFLVANMPVHNSKNYYWADGSGNRIPYNELDYPDFKQSVAAFEEIKKHSIGVHPVPYSYRDIDSMKASMLISNAESAIETVKRNNKNAKSTTIFNDNFFEYILPYRTSIEPLQDWRKIYAERFAELIKGTELPDTQMIRIGQNIKNWFTNTYKIENRGEPLPRLGALQLLHRAKGACEDIAGLAAFMARSQGYAAAVDFVPARATASGVHFLNYVNISPLTKHHYDAADGYILDTLAREPAKVLRTTYSIQSQTIASLLGNDTTQIPDNFMRLQNYKDVTQEYWQTADVITELFKNGNAKVAYVSVWNLASWRPVWYSLIDNNGNANFSNLCKGAVYLPLYYANNKLIPAAWPVINGYDGIKILQPEAGNKRVIEIKEQPKYLVFRPGKKYSLFYWNNSWVKLGVKIPDEQTKELLFENVPSNALLLLMPEYSQGKERPFIVTEKGERFWF
jgi:hypothetical protein